MRIAAWRIYKPRHRRTAFTGEGARLFGGRWNSKGFPVVYTAGSVSLAQLELLVHLQSNEVLDHYRLRPCSFDDVHVFRLDPARLPRNWRHDPAPAALRKIGDEWIASQRTPVLAVPSAVVPNELNFLLNPAHPDFTAVTIGDEVRITFDPRLMKSH